jgi:hypothetical protein
MPIIPDDEQFVGISSSQDLLERASFQTNSARTIYTYSDFVSNLNANPEFVVELIDDVTVDFYAPYDMSIESVADILNSPITTIQVNNSSYVLGNNILKGDKITVSVNTPAVVTLNAQK